MDKITENDGDNINAIIQVLVERNLDMKEGIAALAGAILIGVEDEFDSGTIIAVSEHHRITIEAVTSTLDD